MRFSFNWLKKYLDTDLNVTQIADCLTSIGLEVEEVLDPAVIFKNFKLVKIEKAERHPNADKLQICSVVDGEGNRYQVVCGAPNARAGLTAILALPGALIPASNETLKKSKIRGVESQGMMCSFDELAMEDTPGIDGIIEIPDDVPLITPVDEALNFGGGVLDVSITPNRGDCFSVKGIARDLAAANAGNFVESNYEKVHSNFQFPLDIGYNYTDAFFQYAPQLSFRVIKGVENKESPEWLKSALKTAGMNTISSIVDIANYCMVDNGSPFQIYDLDKIKGSLNLRFAERNEKFVDFTDKVHYLRQDMLISEDEDKTPLCLLGIKSGKKIAVDENTKNILIEAALFDPSFIAKTGTFLDITSDSRTRFERGVDKNSCVNSLEEISRLLIDNCGGTASEIHTIARNPFEPCKVKLTKDKLKSVSGCEINWEKVKCILEKLGLKKISEDEESALFVTPSWRYDLSLEEDLIEEVLRINGYNNVKEKPLNSLAISEDMHFKCAMKLVSLKKLLASRKMSEVVNYSFTKKEYAETFKEDSKLIFIVNPISRDFEVMRPSLIPNLLKTSLRSLNFGEDRVSIFEIGNVFVNSCEQYLNISGIRVGNSNSRNWLNKKRKFDVFDVKADVFAVLDFYGINTRKIKIESHALSYYHPSRSGTIYLGKKILGYFGELHPKINKLFGISERISCFELFEEVLDAGKPKSKDYNDKVFPKIERDFAFIFNERDSVGEIVNGICKLDERIADADIFDSFKINSTQKSIGINVLYDAVDRTLTEDEAIEISEKIVKYVENLGGILRNK